MATIQTRHRPKLISHPLVTQWERRGNPVLRLAYGLIVGIGVLLTVAGTALGGPVEAGGPPQHQTTQNYAPATDWLPLDVLRARVLMVMLAGTSSVYSSLPHHRAPAGKMADSIVIDANRSGTVLLSPSQSAAASFALQSSRFANIGPSSRFHAIFSLIALVLVLATGAAIVSWVKFTRQPILLRTSLTVRP